MGKRISIRTDVSVDELERRYRRVVDPTRRIVLVLDQAGYHTSPLVRVPEGLHLVFLPPDSPELQPVKHLWPFSDQPLVNQHFATSDELDELEDAVAQHCGQIQHQPEILRSVAHFHWLPAAWYRKCLAGKRREAPSLEA